MKELKNLSSYKDFLLEATNTYQVKCNDKVTGSLGNYKDTLKVFKQSCEGGKDGDEIQMIKIKDNKGKDVNVVSKTKTIGGSSKKDTKTKDVSSTSMSKSTKNVGVGEFKKALKDQLLDLFEPPAKDVKYEYDNEGKPIKITCLVNAKDCVNKINPDEQLKNFSFGVSKKKPYLVTVGNVIVDDETTSKAKDSVVTSGDAADKDRIYKISYPISYKSNKEFGKKKEELERNFDKDSSPQLKSKLKSDKYSEKQKDEMRDILKERGVRIRSEFEEDYKTDKEMEKEAEEAVKKVK